jgi:hypothetical protein
MGFMETYGNGEVEIASEESPPHSFPFTGISNRTLSASESSL